MYMAYSNNPHLPRVRMEEVIKVRRCGWSIRQAARYYGFSHGAVINWLNKTHCADARMVIPTLSSRPDHNPKELGSELVDAILDYRARYKRCAEVIHHLLVKDGYRVSLSSVKRTLRRAGLVNHTKWKRWHTYPAKPEPKTPGILVQIDTITDGPIGDRLYVYTLLDVCSRYAYAMPALSANTHQSTMFVRYAGATVPFPIVLVQSDHGSEFSRWFTIQVGRAGIEHRHSRVRRPTDNGHLERFNRTVQDECLSRVPRNLSSYQKAIPEYLHYYNTERPHLALNMRTPIEVVTSY